VGCALGTAGVVVGTLVEGAAGDGAGAVLVHAAHTVSTAALITAALAVHRRFGLTTAHRRR